MQLKTQGKLSYQAFNQPNIQAQGKTKLNLSTNQPTNQICFSFRMGATGSKENRRFPLETQCDHDGGINCMATAEDHSLMATGSEDKTARVWDVSGDKIECIGIIR